MLVPEILLRQMFDRYATCKSYCDTGFIRDIDRPSDRLEFKTYFVRPNKFRFEWTSYHPHFGKKGERKQYMIWTDGRKTYERYHFDDYKIKEVDTLLSAVAGATGISSGTVRTIFSLLLPARPKGRRSLILLHPLARSGASVMGERCYHLETRSSQNEQVDIWISRGDYNLRKLKEHVLISAKFMKECDAELKIIDPELYKETRKRRQPYRDRRYVSECKFTSVIFDSNIDDSIFRPQFKACSR